MRKYQEVFMRTETYDFIKKYVDYIINHTVKGPESAKVTLKELAHRVKAVPVKSLYLYMNDPGLGEVQQQILLEDIGHGWIRKGMPVAEIDWLP